MLDLCLCIDVWDIMLVVLVDVVWVVIDVLGFDFYG